NESGGKAASPIFAAFMNEALAGTPVTQFRYPEGVKFSTIDPRTGVIDVRRVASDGRVIGDTGVTTETVSGARGTGSNGNDAVNAGFGSEEDSTQTNTGASSSSRSSTGQSSRGVTASDAIF
ncbi:MAG: hypothetical protein ACO3NE_14030, partial [Alphaproteobacteria bacterium]